MALAHESELVFKVLDSLNATYEIEFPVLDREPFVQIEMDTRYGRHLEKARVDIARRHGISQFLQLPGQGAFSGRNFRDAAAGGKGCKISSTLR
jgi:hypothetical protein